MNAQLRPGADASRAEAELAAARTLLIQSQQAVEVARVNVSQFVGLPPVQISVAAPKLLQLPPERILSPLDTATNPSPTITLRTEPAYESHWELHRRP